ncbi:MAG: PH domain-containing protein [Erythrobacter sp.]
MSDAKQIAEQTDGDAELTQLHPNYKSALRVKAIIWSLPFIVGALVLEGIGAVPGGYLVIPIAIIALLAILRLPMRRYNARGYNISSDRLRVVRGIWWNSDTTVPFGRVQHIDVGQGPLARFFGIATLTLHTAGNYNSSVHLPGLGLELANEMREEIRGHIKRESA